MKAIPLDPFCTQRARNRQSPGDQRHVCMKARIEARDLLDAGKMRLYRPDDG